MNLLLDTHIFIWVLDDNPRLPRRFREAIASPDNRIHVSSVTLAEIAIKESIGKLRLDTDIPTLKEVNMVEISFSAVHARALRNLPLLHRDPFDRMLICQALTEHLTLLTVDKRVQQYPVPML